MSSGTCAQVPPAGCVTRVAQWANRGVVQCGHTMIALGLAACCWPGGWAFVPNSSDGIAQAVSTAPVMVTLDATHWALYSGGVLDCNAPGTTTNHAVVVVGYVNRVEQPNGELWDVFIVRNRYGCPPAHVEQAAPVRHVVSRLSDTVRTMQ